MPPSSRLVGTSSATRTLDERDLSTLRPSVPAKPRAPRKPSAVEPVTTGIVCFCGERFGEHQALEFMKHLRAEVGDVLDWRENLRRRDRERVRAWAAANPERARDRRRKYSQSEEGRAAKRESDRKRRARKKAAILEA